MKFVISKEELSKLINKIQNIVSLKPPIPLLLNFLLEAKNDELILTATDLMVSLRCHAEAKVIEEGSITLPARRIAQLLRELTASQITMTTKENCVVEILADSSLFKIHGMGKEEFPALPDLRDAAHFKVKQKDLLEALRRISFAVSREDNRYVLTGVLMQIANGMITFAGTDGKKLARSFLASGDLASTLTGSYVVPLKAIEEIINNLEDEGQEATVYLMADKMAVEANKTLLVAKLLAGDYPDIARVIPAQAETYVTLHREELMSLLRQIALFVVDNTQSVRFSFDQGELTLTANSMEIGEGKVSMPANYHSPSGKKLEIAFNPGFFLDILRHSREQTFTLGMTDAYNPGIILEEEGVVKTETANPLYILMPMRLNE
jgi:DNA polymerase-3 subunit beta